MTTPARCVRPSPGDAAPDMSSASFLHEHVTGLPVDLVALREHEAQAQEITLFAPSVLPDLLLCDDYARALWLGNPTIENETVPERLSALRERQQAAFRDGGPVVRVYVSMAALMSEAVDSEITFTQREYLADLVRRHRTSLIVRVLADGFVPAERFALFESDNDDPVVYVPGTVTELFLTAPVHMVAYWALLDSFGRVAWRPRESRTFLAELTARDVADVETQEQAAALAKSFGFAEAD